MRPVAVAASCIPRISFCSAETSWSVWTLVSDEVCCIMPAASMGLKGSWYLSWAIMSFRKALPSRPPRADDCCVPEPELPLIGPIIVVHLLSGVSDPQARGPGTWRRGSGARGGPGLLLVGPARAAPVAGRDVAELEALAREAAGNVADQASEALLRGLAHDGEMDRGPGDRDPHPQPLELGKLDDDMARSRLPGLGHRLHDAPCGRAQTGARSAGRGCRGGSLSASAAGHAGSGDPGGGVRGGVGALVALLAGPGRRRRSLARGGGSRSSAGDSVRGCAGGLGAGRPGPLGLPGSYQPWGRGHGGAGGGGRGGRGRLGSH